MAFLYETIKFTDLNFDLDPTESPANAITSGANIRYDDGKYRRCPGFSPALGTPPHDTRFLLGFPWLGVFHWLSCGTTNVSDVVGSGYNDITNVGGMNTVERWTGDVLNGIPVISTPDIVPQFYNQNINSNLVDLTGWDTNDRAFVIRSYKNFLVALNITKSGVVFNNMVKWSDTADAGEVPQSWDITDPTKQAGETVLASTPGALIDAAKLRDTLILYKFNSCTTMQWIGGNEVFSFRKLFHNIGVMGKNCVVEYEGSHVVLTPDDVVIHDGSSVRSLLDGRMRRWMFTKLNRDAISANFVVAQHLKDEIWICFASGSNTKANLALIWHYQDDSFSVQDLPQADHIASGDVVEADVNTPPPDPVTLFWDEETIQVWNVKNTDTTALRIMMTASDLHYLMDFGDTFDGVEIESFWEKSGMSFGDIEKTKYINRTVPFLTGNAIVEINAGGQFFNTEPIIYGTPVNFEIGTMRRANFMTKAKLVALRLFSKEVNPWEFNGMSVEYKITDRY